MEDKFLGRSATSNSYAALTAYGDKVIVTEGDNGTYTIQWASDNYYLCAWDSYINSNYYFQSSSPFTFSEASYGYTIQRAPGNSYYDATEFVGFDGTNGDRQSPTLGEGSIYWKLLPETETEHYIAKLKLYTYLQVADQYNFYVTQYDVVYNNPNATTADFDFAQATLANALEMSTNYVSPSWTEYPIIFQNNTDNKWESDGSSLRWYSGWDHPEPLTSTLTATVNVDNDATLSYVFSGNAYSTMRVFLDGELVQTVNSIEGQCNRRFFVEMTPGHHDVAWTCVFNNAEWGGYDNRLGEIGIQNTPTLRPQTVLNEGGLGTEVLALGGITGMKDVRKIVVKGKIGTEDWNTLGLMTNAYSIDLSQAEIVDGNVPDCLFHGDSRMFLHEVKLPEGVTSIGEYAFNSSNIEEITFPSTLKTIGRAAFGGSKVATAIIPEGVTSVGGSAFDHCYFLKTSSFPASATTIPYYCFYECSQLRPFTIPEGITVGALKNGGCEIEQLTAFDEGKNTVTFSAVDEMEANQPYIVKTDYAGKLFSAMKGVTVAGLTATSDVTFGSISMHGTYTPETLNSDNTTTYFAYDDSDGSFVRIGSNATESPFRAYLVQSGGNGARKLLVFHDNGDGGVITGVGDSLSEKEVTASDNQAYNLQGQRIAQPRKGVYVKHGKKIIK